MNNSPFFSLIYGTSQTQPGVANRQFMKDLLFQKSASAQPQAFQAAQQQQQQILQQAPAFNQQSVNQFPFRDLIEQLGRKDNSINSQAAFSG